MLKAEGGSYDRSEELSPSGSDSSDVGRPGTYIPTAVEAGKLLQEAQSAARVTAGLIGVRADRIFATATGIAMVVVTIAALYLGARANFDPTIGPARLIYAFEAVIIGGLGSLWGTLAGGVVIGVAQTAGAAVNPEWQILAGPLAFVLVLLLRPRGLFPSAVN